MFDCYRLAGIMGTLVFIIFVFFKSAIFKMWFIPT